jgi:hypothetical protein
MRERRVPYEGKEGDKKVLELLRAHTEQANNAAEETLYLAKQAMKLDFGKRSLVFA